MRSNQITLNRAQRRAQQAANRPKVKQLNRARKAVERQAHDRTGYAMQNYEVRCTYNGQEDFVLGWTNLEDGGPLVKFIEKHPSMDYPVVIKLTDEDKARLSEQNPLIKAPK